MSKTNKKYKAKAEPSLSLHCTSQSAHGKNLKTNATHSAEQAHALDGNNVDKKKDERREDYVNFGLVSAKYTSYYVIDARFHIKDAVRKCNYCGCKSNQYEYDFVPPHLSKFSSDSGTQKLRLICPGVFDQPDRHSTLVAMIDDEIESTKEDIERTKKWFEKNVKPNISFNKRCEAIFDELKEAGSYTTGIFSSEKIAKTLRGLKKEGYEEPVLYYIYRSIQKHGFPKCGI